MNFESPIANSESDTIAEDEAALAARRKRILVIGGALVAAIVLVLVVLRLFGGEDEPQAAAAGPVVTVVRPGTAAVDSIVTATGSLAAVRDMPVGVVGEGGAVSAVLAEPGQWVRKGAVLARVERSVQAEQARSLAASISVAAADAQLAQNDFDRAQALAPRGFISKADLDKKRAARDQAFARVRVARAQLAEQSARNGRLDIRAPEAGLVLTRAVEPGQIVSGGSTVLFRIAQGGRMEMRANVAESDMQRLSPGMKAQVTPVGGARAFDGTVWQVSPVIDPQTRQGTVRISVGYDPALRPGGFAEARMVSGQSQQPVLPESAIQNDDRGSYVLVVNGDNLVERRNVTIGQVSEKGVAIRSGLAGTEQVVLLAGGFLTAGQKVQPQVQRAAGSRQ